MFLLCLSLLLFVKTANSHEIDFNFRDTDGERLYTELVTKAQSYGDCWTIAMSDLRSGCKRLTEEVQSRLALSFSNCFLMQAGLEPCHCADNVPISNCLRKSNDRLFSTYTEFFTHTHSICHYLQHREWQEEASKTVLVLTKSSQLVSRKLDESSKSQSKILFLQQAALNEQKRFISSSRILNAELQQSRENARDMYKEFKITTEEQKFLLFQVFDRVKNLQNFVLGEFSGVYTVVYYVIAITLIYILTSVPRTAGARIWLILVLSLSAVLERTLTTQTLQEDIQEVNPQGVDALIYSRIWLCRKVVCSVCFIILITFYYHYKDYNVINNQLLQEIQQQNKELQNLIKRLSFHENLQNFSPSLNTSTKQSSVLYVNGSIATNAGINGSSEWSTRFLDVQQVSSPEAFADTENTPPSSIPVADSTGNSKTTSRKETLHQKRATRVRSQRNTPTSSSHRQIMLPELESPVPKKYNLRSSSRLNSPQSPLRDGESPTRTLPRI